MKALVGAFNLPEECPYALVGAFSVIAQPVVEPMDRFAALNVSLMLVLDFTMGWGKVSAGPGIIKCKMWNRCLEPGTLM